MSAPILQIDGLRVHLPAGSTRITPVDGVSLDVRAGQALGIVGESGSGKSLLLKAVMGLLPPRAETDGTLGYFAPDNAVAHPPARMRGHGIAMIFQEPMTALNPTMRVGDLIVEAVTAQGDVPRKQARTRSIELLQSVGIPDPATRARMYPHELSGGLRQRVMIATALATEPRLLLCDEPTTALDVTVQDQILGLLANLRRDLAMALIFVSHDLAVVSEVCDDIAVMYAGQIVEIGAVDDVLSTPQHPYTAALIRAAPSGDDQGHIEGIGGRPPDPRAFPSGCRFAPRCAFRQAACSTADATLIKVGTTATSCIFPVQGQGVTT